MDKTQPCTYFASSGPGNTRRTLELIKQYTSDNAIHHIVIASTTGRSGLEACQVLEPARLVIVTHSSGFSELNAQELLPENRLKLEASGAKIVTAAHAFGGIGRAVRRKFGTYQLDEIIAMTLRTFAEGVKVACEITLMSADAGLIGSGEKVVAAAGTSSGLDTALVLRAATTQDYFDLRVLEILCKPRLNTRT